MFRVVLLMAVVIFAIHPQPFLHFCLVKRGLVVARALDCFSCWLDGVTLALTLLAFDAAVSRVKVLATFATEILVPFAVVVGGENYFTRLLSSLRHVA